MQEDIRKLRDDVDNGVVKRDAGVARIAGMQKELRGTIAQIEQFTSSRDRKGLLMAGADRAIRELMVIFKDDPIEIPLEEASMSIWAKIKLMNPAPQSQSAPDERLAGGLMNVVQQLQKNRFGGARRLQGAPIGGESPASEGAEVLNAIRNSRQNEQEQNATPAPGALQKEGGQERGRQRDVGQGEAEGRPGQSSQVQRTEEEQQRRRMR
jgi:hypothetical protein